MLAYMHACLHVIFLWNSCKFLFAERMHGGELLLLAAQSAAQTGLGRLTNHVLREDYRLTNHVFLYRLGPEEAVERSGTG